MHKILDMELVNRFLFTAMLVGILLALGAAVRYVDLSNQLAGNIAAQLHAEGGEVEVESKGQAQGLMASDIQRRRLVSEQFNMMILGGVGLALLGLGWLGNDILGSRRRKLKNESENAEPQTSPA